MSLLRFFDGSAELPEQCKPVNALLYWISTTFSTCIPTPLAFVSTTLGSLSILSWLFAQLPQIFKNYSLGSTSGLSIYFLVEWCLGDISNLLGAWLTRQATWQIVVASYYVIVDIVLVYQYTWYQYIKPRREQLYSVSGDVSYSGSDDGGNSMAEVEGDDVLEGVSPTESQRDLSNTDDNKSLTRKTSDELITSKQASGASEPASLLSEKTIPNHQLRTITSRHSRSSAFLPSPQTALVMSMLCAMVSAHPSPTRFAFIEGSHKPPISETIGRISSWCSTFLYLGSRLPQLYKNYQRRSTVGLSPALFFAAFCGNFFYSTSLLTNPYAWFDFKPYGGHGWAGPEGSNQAEWTALAFPFWLGAAGVLMLDAAVGVQFLMFGEEENDIDGLNAWGRRRKRVTGWMRGWLPNTTPPATPDAERDSLIGSRDSHGLRRNRSLRGSHHERRRTDPQGSGYGSIG
jgi:uncharacterized protein with PQ loop repeat